MSPSGPHTSEGGNDGDAERPLPCRLKLQCRAGARAPPGIDMAIESGSAPTPAQVPAAAAAAAAAGDVADTPLVPPVSCCIPRPSSGHAVGEKLPVRCAQFREEDMESERDMFADADANEADGLTNGMLTPALMVPKWLSIKVSDQVTNADHLLASPLN